MHVYIKVQQQGGYNAGLTGCKLVIKPNKPDKTYKEQFYYAEHIKRMVTMLCSYDSLLLQQGQPFTNICHSCTHNLSHSLDFYSLNVIHTHTLKDKLTHTLRECLSLLSSNYF